jgi:hypothetical protein
MLRYDIFFKIPDLTFYYGGPGGYSMAGNKLTIKLTNDQQTQIRDATGKSVAELNIDLSSTGNVSEKDLDNVAGGAIYIKYGGLSGD